MKYNRVKSGKVGHQVNSDTHLQTVSFQMRRLLMSRLIRIFTVCLVNFFLFQYLKYEKTSLLFDFSCLSEYTRLYPIVLTSFILVKEQVKLNSMKQDQVGKVRHDIPTPLIKNVDCATWTNICLTDCYNLPNKLTLSTLLVAYTCDHMSCRFKYSGQGFVSG